MSALLKTDPGHVAIDQDRCRVLVDIATLNKSHPDVLSSWEVELLWDINERALELGDVAVATTAEWVIVEDMLASLKRAKPPPMN